MDISTLRITFSVLAAALVLLFFFGAFLPTRARFAGWWTFALLLFLVASVAYLGNGTSGQVVLNPIGNALGVAGAEAVWCAGRSLRTRPVRWPWLLAAPAAALVAGAVDDPGHDTWAGGVVFLVLMTAAFGATTRELVHAITRRQRPPRQLSISTMLLRALATASFILTVFYAARTVAFLAVGPHSHAFGRWFGSAPTTVLLIVQLVTVSFSMSSLSAQQQIDDLEQRAAFDQLTGLMRAEEFRRHAADVLHRLAGPSELAVLAMADLDHFKRVNDELGHAAGDEVLRVFGWAARTVLGPRALCGRIGGEEFCLLFAATSIEYAEGMLATLVAEFQQAVHLSDGRVPTISIGMVEVEAGVPLTDLLAHADRALYQAKSGGRSRIVLG